MRNIWPVVAAALLTTACAPLMGAPPYQSSPYAPGPFRTQDNALPIGRWDNVMRLPRASTIDVLTRDGRASIGLITGADEQSVTLDIRGAEVDIARREVVRIDLVDLAGADGVAVARRAARGAAVGTAAMALVAGVIGGPAWPPPGAFLRAGAAGGAIVGGDSEWNQRRTRILYLAPSVARP
jgi:hypothetical protein